MGEGRGEASWRVGMGEGEGWRVVTGEGEGEGEGAGSILIGLAARGDSGEVGRGREVGLERLIGSSFSWMVPAGTIAWGEGARVVARLGAGEEGTGDGRRVGTGDGRRVGTGDGSLVGTGDGLGAGLDVVCTTGRDGSGGRPGWLMTGDLSASAAPEGAALFWRLTCPCPGMFWLSWVWNVPVFWSKTS